MSLSVNIRQHDASDCGVAALASVAAYYGLKLPLAKIRLFSGTCQDGTTIRGLIEAAEKFGFNAKGYKGKAASLYKVPKPAILHLKKQNGFLHYVVLYKISRHHLHLMDPFDGRINRVTFEEFNEEWTGYLIIVEPGSSFTSGEVGITVTSRLLGIIRKDIRKYLRALICSLLYTIVALSTSVFIKYIIDDILPRGDKDMLSQLSVIMLLLVAASFLLSIYRSGILLKLSVNTDNHLIGCYLEHLFKLPQSFFDLRKTGEISSRIDDAFKIRSLLSDVVINISISILTLAVSFVLLFTIFWKLALSVFLFFPTYLVIYWIYDRFNRSVHRKILEEAAQFESSVIESVKSVRTVKYFGMEESTVSSIKDRLFKLSGSIFKAGKWNIAISNSAESNSRLLSLFVLWIGGTFVLSSSITVGELFSFYTVISLFSGPLTVLIGLNGTIREGVVAAERLFEIMDLDIENYNDGVISPLENCKVLKIENLSFRYPGRDYVLSGLSMEITSGEITALKGESGCGKSTLASLILRMHTPDSGIISLDGININHINLQHWRQWVTIVPQNPDLFSGTLIENIAPGECEPDYEQIINLCRELDLLGFIERLPNGFETQIGEGGCGLSRGQQQRFAFARALYRKAKILILDEATSSLDKESEELIERAILKAKSIGCMILMIPHKEKNIQIADKVVGL